MRFPLVSPIASRDGTLAKDSKMVNCYTQPNPAGGVDVVKRPGTALQVQLPAGAGQGMVTFGTDSYAIIANVVYRISNSNAVGLPGVSAVQARMNTLDSNFIPAVAYFPVIKSNIQLWRMDTVVPAFTLNVDADYPASTTSGIAYLDGTYYVMDYQGTIYGSDLNTPLSWNALNFIQTDRGLGIGIFLARHLNYIVAFCAEGLQLFYDAGNPAPGSPLAPMPNATFMIGCASEFGVVGLNGDTIFVSKSEQRGRSVSILSGLSINQISNPYIDKILNLADLSPLYTYGISVAGQFFYVLSIPNSNLTLVYSMASKEWMLWASGSSGGSYFNGGFHCSAFNADVGQDLLLNPTTGAVYTFLPATTTDYESSLYVLIRTAIIDGGSVDPKFIGVINLIGDTQASTVAVTYSKDDYTTFSTSQSIDLSTERKQLRRLGSARRISFDLVHTAATALRLKELEISVDPK